MTFFFPQAVHADVSHSLKASGTRSSLHMQGDTWTPLGGFHSSLAHLQAHPLWGGFTRADPVLVTGFSAI